MAVANSTAAVTAGFNGIHTSVNGLGERAGNTPLSTIVPCIHDHLKMKTTINEMSLNKISKIVETISGIRHNPNKLAKVIMRLICEDFKFNNKQGLVEYMILKRKLKLDDIKEKRASKRKSQENLENKKDQKVSKLINQEEKIAKQFKESRRAESKFTQKYKQLNIFYPLSKRKERRLFKKAVEVARTYPTRLATITHISRLEGESKSEYYLL